MFDNLTDDDQYTLIQLLHEIEHNFGDCGYTTMNRTKNCPMYLRAVENAQRGYLLVIDAMISTKIDEALDKREKAWW